MSDLRFECLDARPEPYTVGPVLTLRLRVTETTGARLYAVALRCQIRVEPQQRRYGDGETAKLPDLFGTPDRWGETLKPLQLASVSVVLPGFADSTETDVQVPCTYDLEVAAGKYLNALDDGEVPLLLLFSGTVFAKSGAGLTVDQIPWDREATYRLPVAVWRQMIDLHFPNSGWLRLDRDTIDALQRFKAGRALPTWDDTVQALLKEITP